MLDEQPMTDRQFLGIYEGEKAKALQEIVRSADCYLIISPEYNHSIPPALSKM